MPRNIPKNRLTFPVDMVLQHPEVMAAPGAAYSAVVTLCLVYWSMGCRDLPTDETSLQSLARLSSPAWFRVKKPVQATLAAILPRIREVWTERVAAWENNRVGSIVGGQARGAQIRAMQRLAKAHDAQSAPALTDAARTTPAASPGPLPHTKPRRPNQPNAAPIATLQAIDKARHTAHASGANAFRD